MLSEVESSTRKWTYIIKLLLLTVVNVLILVSIWEEKKDWMQALPNGFLIIILPAFLKAYLINYIYF